MSELFHLSVCLTHYHLQLGTIFHHALEVSSAECPVAVATPDHVAAELSALAAEAVFVLDETDDYYVHMEEYKHVYATRPSSHR